MIYLDRTQIDEQAWNRCIENSPAGRTYAMTWYLDAVSDHWGGLIENDYSAVMPIVWRKKWGLKIISMPPICQQLGVFSYEKQTPSLVAKFIKHIPKYFVKTTYNWHDQTPTDWLSPFYKTEERPNLILPLNQDYTTIYQNYSTSVKRNLKKANKANLRIRKTMDRTVLINMIATHIAPKMGGISQEIWNTIERLVSTALANEYGEIRMVTTTQDDEVLAIIFFTHQQKRLLNLLSASNTAQQAGAMHFLLDSIIKDYANTNYLFDFEGSAIEGIAQFYQSFGTILSPYIKTTRYF